MCFLLSHGVPSTWSKRQRVCLRHGAWTTQFDLSKPRQDPMVRTVRVHSDFYMYTTYAPTARRSGGNVQCERRVCLEFGTNGTGSSVD